ncbi:MAG: hypothetical protein LUQ07_01275, partial [Methanospirillum sp.]|nr:hypothetical protein [Methanospirillum sp.]
GENMDFFTLLLVIILGILIIWVLLKGLILIRANEVGIVTRRMFGKKLPQGKIIATKGEIGVQSDTLMPGLYFYIPIIWKIDHVKVIEIIPNHIGIVSSIEGVPIPSGRLLGDEVPCNSFQDARMFLDNGGCKGPQIAILKPGTYRINTQIFSVLEKPIVAVQQGKVGIVNALDGIPLLSRFAIAPAPLGDHSHFQNGEVFIQNNGYRGTQLETLQPGDYYINPLLFDVVPVDMTIVPPGNVAVITSSVGEELEKSPDTAPEISTHPDLNQPIHENAEHLLITDKTKRGILRNPIAPGQYNLNTAAYRGDIVPTSAVTIDWASPEGTKETLQFNQKNKGENLSVTEFFKFGQLRVTSQDGFQLEVDVRLIVRIPADNAPFVIARFGSVYNLIEQVAHPLIDASFRNEAGNQQALQFVHDRTKLQQTAFERAQEEFKKYHVEVQGLLIAYIKVDETLLKTQTLKEIAVQQQQQYQQEAKAQEERIAVAEKTARADMQGQVIAAKLSIDINKDNAQAARESAYGTRDATKANAEGAAYANEQVGIGTAKAYIAQKEALGSENVAMLEAIQKIADGNIIITPNILVTGEGSQGGNLLTAYFAALLEQIKQKEQSSESRIHITETS